MGLYTFSVDNLSLSAGVAKTAIELSTAAGTTARVKNWWVEFSGTKVNATPVKIEAGRFTAAVTTATTGTPAKGDADVDPAAATTVKHSTTTEGAGTAEAGVELHRVHPQSRALIQYMDGRENNLAVSTFWRIRLTADDAVNCTVGLWWEE